MSCPCLSDCDSLGCPVSLDFDCVLYHKANNVLTALDGLGLQNGATLTVVIETLDEWVKQVKAADYALPYLRGKYTINSLQQFAEKVDTELQALSLSSGSGSTPSSNVGGFLGNLGSDPTALDGQYYYNTTGSQLKIKVNGGWKVITTT